jgi:DNA-directed RNA polymerase subunit RPC12/RpoP
MNELPRCFTLDEEEYYDFKCVGCGEKFGDEFASDDDVAMCKWCNGEEE